MTSMRSSHTQLVQLVTQYQGAACPVSRADAERSIWERYGKEATVMVVDTAGFSARTANLGIVSTLAELLQMQPAIEGIITDHGGFVVKFVVDNCFALFEHPQQAVAAAQVLLRLSVETPSPHQEYRAGFAVGIDCGKTLIIDDADMFGEPVNTASKLGEDIARSGEILLSDQAFFALGLRDDTGWEQRCVFCSGMTITHWAHPEIAGRF